MGHAPDSQQGAASLLGTVGVVWGVGGIFFLLGSAVVRLSPIALELLELELSVVHWILCAGSVGFMAYSEGYRGFQKNFSPRVVARARHLRSHPVLLHVMLAPVFCMALFHASKKRLIVAWSVLLGVAGLIILVRNLSQPWRGIVDAGVVVGLSWGILAIVYFGMRALRGAAPDTDPGLPG